MLANEFDGDACDTWRENRPNGAHRILEGDINACIPIFSRYAGTTDVIFGGPPCQGFSVAGKMNPDDERNELVWAFLHVVDTVRPKAFVIENVAALGKLTKWAPVREKILNLSHELGYAIAFDVWNALDFGVPQNRERVFFIGIDSNFLLPSSFSEQNDIVRGWIRNEMRRHTRLAPTARQVLQLAGEFSSAENPATCTAQITLAKQPILRTSPYAGMLVNGSGRPVNLEGHFPTLTASMGGNRTPIIDQNALDNPGATNWFAEYAEHLRTKQATPDDTSVPPHIRRLTLKEAALAQSFPADYVFCGPASKQYRQIGNAVPPLLASAIACTVRTLINPTKHLSSSLNY